MNLFIHTFSTKGKFLFSTVFMQSLLLKTL